MKALDQEVCLEICVQGGGGGDALSHEHSSIATKFNIGLIDHGKVIFRSFKRHVKIFPGLFKELAKILT